jgi:diguanylate cyclase
MSESAAAFSQFKSSSSLLFCQARPTKTSPKRSYALIALAWISFAVLLSSFVFYKNIHTAEASFNQKSSEYFLRLQDRIHDTDTMLEGVATLLRAMGNADQKQVQLYVRQILARYPHVSALKITHAVAKPRLEAFIQRQRKILSPSFQVKSFANQAAGNSEPGNDKPVYYPIVLVEPIRPESETTLGLDLETVPFLRHAMFETVKHQTGISSYPFLLNEGNPGYAMFHSILRDVNGASTEEKATSTPYSVHLVINAGKLVGKDIFDSSDGFQVFIHHKDFQAQDAKGQIYYAPGKSRSAIENMLFPLFAYEKTVPLTSSPFTLSVKKQMGWDDVEKQTFFILMILLAGSLAILVWHLRKHQKSHAIQSQHEQLLWDMANHDCLTGLPNRRGILHQVEQTKSRAARHSEKFGIMFLDLNDFKSINDLYGHETGDQLLQLIAKKLLASIRVEDCAARFGGDEFVVLIDGIDNQKKLDTVAAKIAGNVAAKFTINQQPITAGVSIGTAIFPDDGTSISELFEIADKKMYEHKRQMQRLTTCKQQNA